MEVELQPGALIQDFSAPVYLNLASRLDGEEHIVVIAAHQRSVCAHIQLFGVGAAGLCQNDFPVLWLVARNALALYHKICQLAVQPLKHGRCRRLIRGARRYQLCFPAPPV